MKTTVFNCDKCGQPFEADQSDKPKPFVTDKGENVLLEVEVEIGKNMKSNYGKESGKVSAQICRECIEKAGLNFNYKTGGKSNYPILPSVTDKIIDILSELGVKFEE